MTAYVAGRHLSLEHALLTATVRHVVPLTLGGYNWHLAVESVGDRADNKGDMSQAFGPDGVSENPGWYKTRRAGDAHIAMAGSSTSMGEQMGLGCDRLRLYSSRIHTEFGS